MLVYLLTGYNFLSWHLVLLLSSNAKELRFHYSLHVRNIMKLVYLLMVDVLLQLM